MNLSLNQITRIYIVPTLCAGMPMWTLRVLAAEIVNAYCDAERLMLHSRAERGNDQLLLPR